MTDRLTGAYLDATLEHMNDVITSLEEALHQTRRDGRTGTSLNQMLTAVEKLEARIRKYRRTQP